MCLEINFVLILWKIRNQLIIKTLFKVKNCVKSYAHEFIIYYKNFTTMRKNEYGNMNFHP